MSWVFRPAKHPARTGARARLGFPVYSVARIYMPVDLVPLHGTADVTRHRTQVFTDK
jgi:hypothetical protein